MQKIALNKQAICVIIEYVVFTAAQYRFFAMCHLSRKLLGE